MRAGARIRVRVRLRVRVRDWVRVRFGVLEQQHHMLCALGQGLTKG